ncbi:integral membrane plasmid transfer protein [Streptomyces bryophytorum]|nr:integral membrane plasmid transfer protein [Actinacidiphila bryophytorum]MBN6545542.1 integral membrane plasmid transfer protein [Actinacidiphila bryophytorum]
MARPVDSSRTEANLDAARADVKAEIARTDAKVSLLLAFVGALLAGVWTVGSGRHLPVAAEVLGGAGVSLLAAVAGVLLRAARPNLGGARPVGFPRWATLTADELRAELASDDRPQHIAELSRIAVAKFVHLRRAIDLTCLAGALLIATFAVTVAGGAR